MMPLGMEVGLSSGDFNLCSMGTQLPTPKGAEPPIFSPRLL